jgi:hypothetical protein
MAFNDFGGADPFPSVGSPVVSTSPSEGALPFLRGRVGPISGIRGRPVPSDLFSLAGFRRRRNTRFEECNLTSFYLLTYSVEDTLYL